MSTKASKTLRLSLILSILSLLFHGCDDPVPGTIGGLILMVRSFEATSDADVKAIDSIEITTSHVEIEHSQAIGTSTRLLSVDTANRTIIIANKPQTDRLIAQYQAPPGYIYQIKIFPKSVVLHLKNGTNLNLTVPSSNLPSWDQSGWKIEPIDGNPWPIQQDQLTGVRTLFDFDERVLHNKGNGYKIKPTAPAEIFPVSPENDGPGVFADQIAVVFKRDASLAEITSIISGFGSRIVISPTLSTVYRIKIPPSKTIDDAYAFFSSNSTVQAVLPAVNYSNFCTSITGALRAQSLLKADNAWMRLCSLNTVGSYKIRVAVIDTGIDLLHPDLWMNIGITQGEIPANIKSQILTIDCDNDGVISLYDLNYCPHAASLRTLLPQDYNNNGFIDALDIISPNNPWRNGQDDDGSGKADDFVGWNFADDNNDPTEPWNGTGHGHGTAVAGVIGAMNTSGNSPQGLSSGIGGMIWRVSIIPVRVNNKNLIPNVDEVRYFDALNYVENIHADIVNLSQGHMFASEAADLGCGIVNDQLTKGIPIDKFANARAQYMMAFRMLPWYDTTINRTISTTTYFGAAGNSALNIDGLDIRNYPSQALKEALGSNVMLVGAIQSPTPLICNISNYGSTVDLWAPGLGWNPFLTPDGRFRQIDICGTSFSSPAAAGTAALILTKSPSMQGQPSMIRGKLISSGSSPPAGGAFFISPCNNNGMLPSGPASLLMIDADAAVR